jgi:uncharacterized protein YndB with AHSA1/START domain
LVSQKYKSISQSVIINAPPEKAYHAYLNAKTHEAFTGESASSDARVGGKMTAWDGYISGRYLELVEGKRIVQEWKTSEWPEGYPPSLLELTFKPASKSRTRLLMIHSKVPLEQVKEYEKGWLESYWRPLQEYFRKPKRMEK